MCFSAIETYYNSELNRRDMTLHHRIAEEETDIFDRIYETDVQMSILSRDIVNCDLCVRTRYSG